MKQLVEKRSALLARARLFFSSRGIAEIDAPMLSPYGAVDTHIDSIRAFNGSESRFLHTSPEYSMKRLLAAGCGDIYFLGHVFRAQEEGERHQPEFTMAEWYRLGFTFDTMIEETAAFIREFLGPLSCPLITYREAFLQYADIDPFTASERDLEEVLRSRGALPLPLPENRDDWLNLILGIFIEPKLGKDSLCALWGYPSSQAALAQTRLHEEVEVAERFEIYYRGIELANGYAELACSAEQNRRFKEANEQRIFLSKEPLAIDERFLSALDQLPPCCGVAVGFDRLAMLHLGCNSLAEALPLPWREA